MGKLAAEIMRLISVSLTIFCCHAGRQPAASMRPARSPCAWLRWRLRSPPLGCPALWVSSSRRLRCSSRSCSSCRCVALRSTAHVEVRLPVIAIRNVLCLWSPGPSKSLSVKDH